MFMTRGLRITVVMAMLLGGVGVWSSGAQQPDAAAPASPPGSEAKVYKTVGETTLLLRAKPDYQVEYPQGYRNWKHVASSLYGPQSPAYDRAGGLHHFYANEKAVEGYRTGKFPDGSVIVDERNKAQEKDGVTKVGERLGVAVMVKDGRSYAETGGWGFEVFRGENPAAVLTAQGRATCYSCHAKKKDPDFVYTTMRQ